MINFRYHIVSLVAVFLALAIGVVMGSTVIDRVTVETLEAQQDRLDTDLAAADSTNKKIEGELDDLRHVYDQVTKETAERLVPGALLDLPVLLLGVRGNEVSGFSQLLETLTLANAKVQATLWFTERFELKDANDRKKLAEILSVNESSSSSLRRGAISRLGASLRQQVIGAPVADAQILAALVAAGFVDIDAVGQDATLGIAPGTRMILLGAPRGTGTEDDDDKEITAGDKSLAELLLGLTQALTGGEQAPADLVVAEAAIGEQLESARLLESLRDEKSLAGRFSSVDNIDESVGRIAAVLALRDLGVDYAGHYGSGPGAKQLIPALPPAPPAP